MHSNLPVFSIFIPLLFATINMFFKNKILMQKKLTFLATTLVLITSLLGVIEVSKHSILILEMGNWVAPFGITLTLDGLNSILILTSSVVFLATLIYSFKTLDKDTENSFFYSGFLLIMVGVNGAFTTGDIFNLFVFYEILLMSSYLLLLVGIKKEQLKSSISYIFMNVFAGSLFVISIGYLYTVVGTLNMAHISEVISNLEDKRPVFLIGAVMLFVFAMKGALFPLFTWMNRTYAATPIAVSIIFSALLTKVGLYSIIRTYSLFYYDSYVLKNGLLITAILSIIVGCLGALYQRNLKQIIIFNIVISLGVMVAGTVPLNEHSIKGTILYAINDILLKAVLFMFIGIIIYICNVNKIQKVGLINKYPILGWSFFITTLAISGIPPLSGFYGKSLIIRGLIEDGKILSAVIVALSGLIVLYSLIRIFLNIFYDSTNKKLSYKKLPIILMLSLISLIAIAIIVGFSSNIIDNFLTKASYTVLEPENYIKLVLQKGK